MKMMMKNNEFEHPLRDIDFRRAYFVHKIKLLDKDEDKFVNMLENYFFGQMKRLIERLQPIPGETSYKKDLIDDEFNIENEITIAVNEYIPLGQQFLLESGQDSLNFINYPHRFLLSSEIEGWLDNKANVYARQINETTFKKLKREFEESVALEEPRGLLVERIENTYENITKNRAATIARTEVLGITQKGTLSAYEQAMIPIKIWVSILDGRTRDSHIVIDGEERPTNIPFSNGLMYPGDPQGQPHEIINCRCVI